MVSSVLAGKKITASLHPVSSHCFSFFSTARCNRGAYGVGRPCSHQVAERVLHVVPAFYMSTCFMPCHNVVFAPFFALSPAVCHSLCHTRGTHGWPTHSLRTRTRTRTHARTHARTHVPTPRYRCFKVQAPTDRRHARRLQSSASSGCFRLRLPPTISKLEMRALW